MLRGKKKEKGKKKWFNLFVSSRFLKIYYAYELFEYYLKIQTLGSFQVAQQVKDPLLSMLWCMFEPQSRNFHMLQAKAKTKQKIKKKVKKNQVKLIEWYILFNPIYSIYYTLTCNYFENYQYFTFFGY